MRLIRCWRRLGLRSGLAVAVALSAVVVLASCTSVASSDRRSSAPSGRVISLTRISTLKSLFSRDAGHPRLLLLLSPT